MDRWLSCDGGRRTRRTPEMIICIYHLVMAGADLPSSLYEFSKDVDGAPARTKKNDPMRTAHHFRLLVSVISSQGGTDGGR
jgi:hypothetical protein